MTLLEEKKRLRVKMLSQRARMDGQQKQQYDQSICNLLLALVNENEYKTVHCYLPMGEEIDIRPFIHKLLIQKLTVVTPKTLPKRQLQHLVLDDLSQVEAGRYGTVHPANSKEYFGAYDLIIVPGLAFSTSHYRLGYGGGYYDHFLAQHPKAYKLGIGYPFQQVEQIPLEFHDVQLDGILWDSLDMEIS